MKLPSFNANIFSWKLSLDLNLSSMYPIYLSWVCDAVEQEANHGTQSDEDKDSVGPNLAARKIKLA